MNHLNHFFFIRLLAVCLLASPFALAQPVSVLTHRYNNQHSGWNNREQVLTTQNVNSKVFGAVFTVPVDDQVYAQPLVVAGLTIKGSVHNTVFVATVNNSVYAFDADLYAPPLWKVNLTPNNARVIRNADMTGACDGNYKDFSGNMGIVGTPVIDTARSALYVVSRDLNSANKYEQYLHALDLATGAEKPNSPVLITATYKGSGAGSAGGTITFDAQKHNQRPALLLHNGVVYICWASHCDWGPYHGWVMGYDAAKLTQKYVYNNTPMGYNGGIWMSGSGPTVDANGFLYLSTGNGSVGAANDPNNAINRGESLLKLNSALELQDFFTPKNYSYLEQNDLDYGVGGVLLIPNTTLILSGSKEGKLYVTDTKNLGKYSPDNEGVVQELAANTQTIYDRHIHGTPVYAKTDTAEYVYVWAESDNMRQFVFDRKAGKFSEATLKGTIRLDYGMPGGTLTVSSAGEQAGTGIVWVIRPSTGDANHDLRPGTLDAYDARDIRKLIWSSSQVRYRDDLGLYAKFNAPVVANGKVYLATFSNQLVVYGILPPVTGVTKATTNDTFRVYPNPTTGAFSVDYTANPLFGQLTLKVYDTAGQLILQSALPAAEGAHTQPFSLPASLAAGTYHVLLYGDQSLIQARKLVVN